MARCSALDDCGQPAIQQPADSESIETTPKETTPKETPKGEKARRKMQHKKVPERDIFLAFGKEHDKRSISEVLVEDGHVIHRMQPTKFWQSESDLHRWQQSLKDASRYQQQITQVREKWHQDWSNHRGMLADQHNALFRQRSVAAGEQQLGSPQSLQQLRDLQRVYRPPVKKANKKLDAKRTPIEELGLESLVRLKNQRDLHDRSPRVSTKPALETPMPVPPIVRVRSFEEEKEQAAPSQQASLEVGRGGGESQSAVESRQSEPSPRGRAETWSTKSKRTESASSLATDRSSQCSHTGRHAGAHGCSFQGSKESPLEPYLEENGDPGSEFQQQFEHFGKIVDALSTRVQRCHQEWGECGVDLLEDDQRPSSGAFAEVHALAMESWEAIQKRQQKVQAGDPSDQLPQVQLPHTMSILVFRNADRVHAGEVVLLRRWPPASMASFIEECGQACRPVAGPAKQLFDTALVPVNSAEEVTPGGAYLLKGPEALDPPATFFKLRPDGALSFRALTRANTTLSSDFEQRLRAMSSVGCNSPVGSQHLSSTTSRAISIRSVPPENPPAGSPPWKLSQSASSLPAPAAVSKWQEPKFASTAMSWGGLSRPTKHHDFATWGRVLERSQLRGAVPVQLAPVQRSN